jgi:hypothetical protein
MRRICGKYKVSRLGNIGADKTKWCEINPPKKQVLDGGEIITDNIQYPRQRELAQPLSASVNQRDASRGMFLSFPNGGFENIDTVQSFCELFTYIDYDAPTRMYTTALNTNRNFGNGLFAYIRVNETKQLHGTLGFCLRIDNPAFAVELSHEGLTPDTWKGQNYNLIPRYLYSNVCRLFMTVRVFNNGTPDPIVSCSLKPRR